MRPARLSTTAAQGDRPTVLKIFAFKDRKETTIAEDIRGYALSDDGSKLLVAQGPGYNIYDATPQGDKTQEAGFDRRAVCRSRSGGRMEPDLQ